MLSIQKLNLHIKCT